MKNLFTIKELKINPDDKSGVELISFVESPAIEANFDVFKYDIPDILPFFKFTAAPEPERISTSHPFCIDHAGRVYHESEINDWATLNHSSGDTLNHSSGDYYSAGWIQESDFFQTFDGNTATDFSGSQQLYNCRHTLRRVSSINEVPRSKWKYLNASLAEETGEIFLELSSDEKREVSGPVLISGKMIFRSNADGLGSPGYVFFSRETVRLAMKKYGFNRSISVQHKSDFTGSAILLDSWLTETDNQTIWNCRYKIIGEELWQFVKTKKVLGFSVESLFSF
jgi:hypothetical protein